MENDFMNFQKIIIFFSLLTFVQNSFGYICVNSTSNYKMFGSTLRADVLKNPFIIAFQQEHFTDYKIQHADNDTQLIDQIQDMSKEKCSLILGLFTSQDCLVTGNILKKNKIIGLSSSCSDNHIQEFFPYLYTAAPKLSDFSKMVADYTNTHNTGDIYALYQPSDAYSNYGFMSYKKFTKKDIIPISVSSNGNINLEPINSNKMKTIIFFTYPLPSAQILVNLDGNNLLNKNVNVIGASSWIFDVSVFKPIKLSLVKTNSVKAPSVLNKNSIDHTYFSHTFSSSYLRKPDVVEVLTYDMTKLAITCYKKSYINNKINNKMLLSCVQHIQYPGISGLINFQNNSSFPKRKIYLVNFIDRV